MILKAFSVFDCKAEAYLPPFFTSTTALAMRSFGTAANTADHDFHKYAADYTLFEIGWYDDSNGLLDSKDAHSNLGTALTFIARENSLELARQETN